MINKINKSNIRNVSIINFENKINKRGNLLVNENIRVIMAVAVAGLIIILLFKLFSPVFNVADETAESYFDMLERAIENLPSSFFMMDNGDDDLNFSLVYFGEAFGVSGAGDLDFTREPDSKKNVLCVCSRDKSAIVCKYCKGMKKPASFDGNIDNWFVREGVRVSIGDKEGHYVFSSE